MSDWNNATEEDMRLGARLERERIIALLGQIAYTRDNKTAYKFVMLDEAIALIKGENK